MLRSETSDRKESVVLNLDVAFHRTPIESESKHESDLECKPRCEAVKVVSDSDCVSVKDIEVLTKDVEVSSKVEEPKIRTDLRCAEIADYLEEGGRKKVYGELFVSIARQRISSAIQKFETNAEFLIDLRNDPRWSKITEEEFSYVMQTALDFVKANSIKSVYMRVDNYNGVYPPCHNLQWYIIDPSKPKTTDVRNYRSQYDNNTKLIVPVWKIEFYWGEIIKSKY